MKVMLVRHPPVALTGICYGQSDVMLAQDWRDHANRLKANLKIPNTIFCSPAYRCRALAQYLGLKAIIDPRLKELDFGSWELQPWKAIPRHEIDEWTADLDHANPYNGESCLALKHRAMTFWKSLIAQNEDALVIGHTGWIHALLAELLNTDMRHITRLKIDYCGRTLIDVQDDMVHLAFVNR